MLSNRTKVENWTPKKSSYSKFLFTLLVKGVEKWVIKLPSGSNITQCIRLCLVKHLTDSFTWINHFGLLLINGIRTCRLSVFRNRKQWRRQNFSNRRGFYRRTSWPLDTGTYGHLFDSTEGLTVTDPEEAQETFATTEIGKLFFSMKSCSMYVPPTWIHQ